MAEGKPFFGGIPVEPDVKKLHETLGVPKKGTTITHETLEEILGMERRNGRYTTIVTAWRKKLLSEENIDTNAEIGVGIKVLTEEERIGATTNDLRKTARQAVKTHVRASKIETAELNDVNLRKVDGLRANTAVVASAVAGAVKEVKKLTAPPRSTPQMPRVVTSRRIWR